MSCQTLRHASRFLPLQRLRRRFTLVELLVVVSIIAVLAAMLLPVLNKARDSAKRTKELGALKQVSTAAQLYEDDYNHMIQLKSKAVPKNAFGFDSFTWGYAGPHWPWMLASEYGYNPHGFVLVNNEADMYPMEKIRTDSTTAISVSYFVSFGFNAHMLSRNVNAFSAAPAPMYSADPPKLASMAKDPSYLIYFGGARSEDTTGASPYGYTGYYRIEPPQLWASPVGFSPAIGSFGYLAPRYNRGDVVVGQLDGHVEVLDIEELRKDQRRFNNDAAVRNDPTYILNTPITHTN